MADVVAGSEEEVMGDVKKDAGAVVLLSGGMDSAWCLYWARANYARVWAVWVDYGQRNGELEQLAAHRIAAKVQVPLSIYLMRVTWNATLCALSRPLRTGTDEDGISNAFVPGRNLHLLTVAGARTREVDANELVIGCCGADESAFPDCRVAFLESAAVTLSHAYQKTLRVVSPLSGRSKAWALAEAAKYPGCTEAMASSWSCYTPTRAGEPCHECDACTLRAKAFQEIGSC